MDKKLPSNSSKWRTPSRKHRFASAAVDLVLWTGIWILGMLLFTEIGYAVFGKPIQTGNDPRNEITVLAGGISAVCANLYLAIANGAGRSLGKALNGLRLVVIVGPHVARPGFARGLVRSALQAGPWMGIVMYCTGVHDRFAGTTIIQEVDDSPLRQDSGVDAFADDMPNAPPIAIWKIALAVVIHLFCGIVYMFVGAL